MIKPIRTPPRGDTRFERFERQYLEATGRQRAEPLAGTEEWIRHSEKERGGAIP